MNPISRREFLKGIGTIGIGIGIATFSNCIQMKQSGIGTTSTIESISLRRALFYDKFNSYLRCGLCPNRCVILDESRGICGVRINKNHELYTLAYGNPCAVHVDPIEKKPLFHYFPSSRAFSIATAGCCLRCKYCQNWQISQKRPDDIPEDVIRRIISELERYTGISSQYDNKLIPQDIVKFAKRLNCRSIAYTYTEPTIFYEYMYEISEISKKNDIKNVIVTCGYINEDPLRELCKFLDAGNVNLKGFSDEFYKKLTNGYLQPILDMMLILKEERKWFEITYLIIPGWSDDDEQIGNFINWILDNLGSDYPVHFLRFMPAYKMRNVPPTPPETLNRARDLAIENGLRYVYIGNLPGSGAENTYCHSCGKILIKRHGFIVLENNINNGRCRFCGKKIPGVWG